MNSKVKGNAGEREIAHILEAHGYTAHRGIQYNPDRFEADVEGLPGIHIEVKRVEQLNIYKAMEQSIRDAKDGEMPVVIHRRNRDYWKVTMRLEEWLEIYRKAAEYDKGRDKHDKSTDA